MTFTADQFTATKWDTAEDKAKFANWLKDFIRKGCPADRFPKTKYNRLSRMFGHIAEYDVHGFINTWFSRDRHKLAFVEKILRYPCYGDPSYTWSDVETAIQEWIRSSDVFVGYLERAEVEHRNGLMATAAEALTLLSAEDREKVLGRFS
jgi:hypothetical protein